MPQLQLSQICTSLQEVLLRAWLDMVHCVYCIGKDEKLMYLENNDDDADAWLVISKENSDS